MLMNSQFTLLRIPKNVLISRFGEVHIDSLPDRIVLTMEVLAYPSEERFAPDAETYTSGFIASLSNDMARSRFELSRGIEEGRESIRSNLR